LRSDQGHAANCCDRRKRTLIDDRSVGGRVEDAIGKRGLTKTDKLLVPHGELG
jgi:hypothetical protein